MGMEKKEKRRDPDSPYYPYSSKEEYDERLKYFSDCAHLKIYSDEEYLRLEKEGFFKTKKYW